METIKDPNIEHKTVKHAFKFKLSKDDYVTKAKNIAELNEQVYDLNSKFDMVKREHKTRVESLLMASGKELVCVRDGEEEREVECIMVMDFNRNLIEYVYQGEILQTRSMSDFERQRNLFPMKEKTDTTVLKEGHSEIVDVIASETNTKTKHSSVDGAKG